MNFFIFVDENSVNCIKSDGKVELLNMDYIELSFFFRGGGTESEVLFCACAWNIKKLVALREY